MATVLNKPQTNAAKVDAKLSQELAQVTSRIRGTDILSGGLTLVALVLGYTLVAVLADKLLDLPAWARLGGLAVFLVTMAVAGWFTVVRPLRSRINPRYAARQVEQTLSDGKNAVINWVDLQDQNLPESVRAAVGARAAEGVADADVASVSESRRVLVPLASVGLLVAGLALFFVLVKSAPFFSLLNRAYNPFTTSGIATRTVITLDEPAGGDVTVTSGDSLTVRVSLAGTLPDAKSAERARLLVRYNPEAEEFDEIDLDTAGSKREFATKLPPSVIQNGLRYRVAAGDARTPEFAVTVRTRPLLKDFTVKYEYPAYTRLLPETTTEARIEGYRGTKVTLTARANRNVRDARLVFDGQSTQVAGVVAAETPDAASFAFTLDEPGNYRVAWTAADGEAAESPAYPIRLLVDQAPSVTITSPKEEETTLPADGLLKVDGVAADDFGLTTLTLRLRVAGTPPVVLEGKKYRDGKSFRRASDQSDPTVLDSKDSVKLSTLKTKAGDAVVLEPGSVIEYWLEAADNCTVPPGANVGKSRVQRVKIAPPAPPAEQKQQEQNKADRGQQEQKHQADMDQQQGNEKRQPPQPRPENVDKKPDDGQDKKQDGQPGQQDGKPPEAQPNKGADQKSGEGQPQKGSNEPKPNPDQPPMTKPPESGNGGEKSTPSQGEKQPPQDPSQKPKESGEKQPGDQGIQDQADKVQKELNNREKQPSETRPAETNPQGGEKPPAEAGEPGKPKPQGSDTQKPPEQASDTKPQPGSEGQPKSENKPAEGKPQGGGEKVSQPEDRAKAGEGGDPQAKPQPKPGQGGEPKAGTEKPTPSDANPKTQDGSQGSDTKPMAEPQAGTGKPGDPKPGTPQGEPKPQPGANSGQPEEKPGEPAKPGGGQPKAGEGKPQTPPKAGTSKPTPSDATKGPDEQPPKSGETPTDGNAGEAKPAGKPEPKTDPNGKPTGAGEQPKGAEKPTEKPTPGSGAGEKKPDPKELEQAIKDLKSGDPAKQQAARDKLDKAMGKENREAAEAKADQLERDLKGDDKAKQEAARKEIEAMAKQAEKAQNEASGGKDNKGDSDGKGANGKKGDQPAEAKQPTPEQVKEAQKLQDDLTSKDDATREAAEKKVDDAVGKEQREQLQQDLKDAQSGDPAKADAAKKRLEQQAKPKPGDQAKGSQRGPGSRPDTPGDKLDENTKNRRKTADLQLKDFEKAKGDAELQKKLGYTPEQYDEFLKGYRDLVQRQNDAADKPEVLPMPPEAGGPTTIKVGEGATTKPLDKKSDGTSTAGGGVGTAPPGFSDAQRKFAEEAAKLRKPDPKK